MPSRPFLNKRLPQNRQSRMARAMRSLRTSSSTSAESISRGVPQEALRFEREFLIRPSLVGRLEIRPKRRELRSAEALRAAAGAPPSPDPPCPVGNPAPPGSAGDHRSTARDADDRGFAEQ